MTKRVRLMLALLAVVAAALVLAVVVLLLLQPANEPAAAPELVPQPHASAVSLLRDGQPGVIAHRGGTTDTPENTLPAFRESIQRGYDYVETDVRLTADGVPVLLHDSDVTRTTNGAGAVSALPLQELRKLDAGSWFGPKFVGTQVPTLGELAELLAGADHTRGLIEFKGKWTGAQLAEAVTILRDYQLSDRAVLMAADVDTLQQTRVQAPEFARVLLVNKDTPEVLAQAEQEGAAAVGAGDVMSGFTPAGRQALQAAKIGLLEYTLDTPAEWQRAQQLGADFIISDDPAGLTAWLGQHRQ